MGGLKITVILSDEADFFVRQQPLKAQQKIAYNIRKLQMFMKRGENKEIREELHKCMLCGKCILVCPRGVDTRKMILSMMKYIKNNQK